MTLNITHFSPVSCHFLPPNVQSPHITNNDLLVTRYKAAPGDLSGSRHGASSGACGAAGGGGAAAGGTSRSLAQLADSEHKQAQVGRIRAFRQGSLPVHLPYGQPRQLRLSRESAVSLRTALPLLAAKAHRYVGICHHLHTDGESGKKRRITQCHCQTGAAELCVDLTVAQQP